MKQKKNVLVVGGAGYVGGSVTDLLREKGIAYTVYDNLLFEDRYLKPGGSFILGDVRDTKKLGSILADFTDVIWLAGIVGDGACFLHQQASVAINEKSVKWLSKNFRGRILFTSSCSVYGSNDSLLNEESSLNPLSLYAKSKIKAEQLLKSHPNTITFRLGTLFGLSDTYARLRNDLVINTLAAGAVRRGVITVFGGSQKRPVLHVRNIAQTLVHNLFTKNTGIYNIATHNCEIYEIARMVEKETKCKVKCTGKRFEDNRHYNVSCAKAVKDKVISVDPKKDILYGIREVAELLSGGRIKDLDNDLYSNLKHVAKVKI